MGTSEFMLAGLLPAIADDLDVPVGTAGLLTSGFAVCHVVGAAASAFELLLVTRVLSALANAGFLAVALRTVALLVPAERTGRTLAVLLSGTTIATVVGVPAGAVLGAALSWRAPFAAVALLCLPALLGILRGVPTTIRGTAHVRPRSAPGTAPAPTPFPGPAPSLRTELALLVTPRLAVAMSLAALVNAGTFRGRQHADRPRAERRVRRPDDGRVLRHRGLEHRRRDRAAVGSVDPGERSGSALPGRSRGRPDDGGAPPRPGDAAMGAGRLKTGRGRAATATSRPDPKVRTARRCVVRRSRGTGTVSLVLTRTTSRSRGGSGRWRTPRPRSPWSR